MFSISTSLSLDELAISVSETLVLTSLFHWGLFGILTIQIFLYYKSFSRDRLAIRAIMYSIYVMEATQTAWVARKLYLFCGSGYGNAALLLDSRVDPGDEAFVIKTGLVGLLCQCFSAWRIWVLSRSKLMAGSVVVLSLLSTTATIVGGAHILRFSGNVLPRDITTIIWASTSALCDTAIAIFMGLILTRAKGNVHQDTRALITKLLWLTVTTGSLTAFMAWSALVLLLVSPNAEFYFPVIVLIGKVEANSSLAVLNSRIRLGSDTEDAQARYSDRHVASGRFEVELGVSSESRRSVQQRVELPLSSEGDETKDTTAFEV